MVTARERPDAPGPAPRPGEADGHRHEFEALRALAAFGVVVFHATFLPFAASGGPYELVAQLQAGVEVFFVLSGFLLYRPMVAAHLEGRPPGALRHYAARRAIRLFPAYWVVLVVTVVLGQMQLDSPGSWLAHLSLTQIYSKAEMGAGMLWSWTLSIEVVFYAFLPCYAWLIRRLGARVGVVRAEVGGVVGLAVVGVLYQALVVREGTYLPWVLLPYYFPVFAAGIGLAVAHTWLSRRTEPPRIATRIAALAPWMWSLVPFLLVLGAATYGAKGIVEAGIRYRGLEWIRTAIALCLVLPAVFVASPPGRLRAFLRLPLMVFLGAISYGVYLWHDLLIRVYWFDVQGLEYAFEADGWQTLAVVVLPTIVVASASWYLLERPLLRRVRRRQVRA